MSVHDRNIAIATDAPVRRVLNLRLLLVSALSAGLIAVTGHVWHAFQMKRNATSLLGRVDEALAADDRASALARLRQYLKLLPDDAQQVIRLARLVDRDSTARPAKAEALRLYTLAIGLTPEHADLLRRRAELSYELGYFADAVRQADDLLRKNKNDSDAVRVKALALAAQARLAGETPGDRLAELFERALKDTPGDVELAVELAKIYRAQIRDGGHFGPDEKAAAADRVMKRLIDAAPRSPDAYLARYQYRDAYGLAGADDDLRTARALDTEGKHFAVLLAAGLKQLAQGTAQEAAALFDRAIAANPDDERGYLGLGRAREAAGDRRAAQAAWRQGLRAAASTSPVLNFELARSLIEDGSAQEARHFVDRLENELRRRAGQITPAQRARWHDRAALLRADWHFAQGEFARAAELFEELAGRLPEPGDARHDHEGASRLHARLAASLGRLGQWDRAITEYEISVALTPDSAERRLALADAYQRAGRHDDAVNEFHELCKLDSPPPSAWVRAARAQLEQQLAAPPQQRHWNEFIKVLEQARRATPEDPELRLLETEHAFATQADSPAATRLMQYVEATRNENFCERACAVLQRWRRLEDADRCLHRAAQLGLAAGRRALTAAALEAARGHWEEAEKLLRSALESETGQRVEMGLRLAIVLLAAGQTQRAKDELEALYRQQPEHLRVVQILAELAWEDADLRALEVNEQRLRTLEGPGGTLWRFFRGLRLSLESDDRGGPGLTAAEQLQAEIERARPNWSAGFLLKGRLADQRKRPDEAITAYFKAIDLGERREPVYAYLATRLYQQGRYTEAHELLEELKSRQPLTIHLSGLELALDVRTGDLPSAIAAARHHVANRPTDAAAHVWLGQVLQLGGKRDEAEAALQHGIALAPTDARPWIALLHHYLATGELERARQTFNEMQKRIVVSARQRPFLLAQCHELLGDLDTAASFYRQALAAAPEVPAVCQSAARFYLGYDRDQAETCLRRLIELRPDAPLARRMLAALVVAREGEASLTDAAALLQTPGTGQADQSMNQRLSALLALRHGTPQQRQEAQRLLEELVGRDKSYMPRERTLLAHWYESEGRIRAAKDQLLALALVDQPRPDDLARLAEFLLRHGRADEADDWLEVLSQAEPESGSLRTLSLRVKWLVQRGERTEIDAAINRFLSQDALTRRSPLELAATWTSIAELYDVAELHEQAEASYRRAASQHTSGGCSYARWLAANHRVGEAVQACLSQRDADTTPQTAITLAALLSQCADTVAITPRIEQFFTDSLSRHPTSAMLRAALGTLYMLQSDESKAQTFFTEALELQPDHLVALNNLAMLLADDPARRNDAMAHLDRALVVAGRHPELLDSKGWLLLQSDEAAAAEPLFREAAELAPGDPRPSFHLALSCWLQGKLDEAREALGRARQRKLSVNQLNPPERRRLADLELEVDG